MPSRNAQQPFEVQVIGADAQPAVRVPPLASRAVGVNLDAVSFRVVEIQGLADEVVGGAGQRESLFEGPPQEAAQLLLTRQKNRKVVEAGRVARPLLAAGQDFEAQQRRAAGSQRRGAGALFDSGQPEPLVEIHLALEVEDLELDRSERPIRCHSVLYLPGGADR